MDEKMVSVSELAQLWSVSPGLIRRLIARRENGLRGYKISGKIRIKVSDAQSYLATNEIKPAERAAGFSCPRISYKPGMKVVSL